MRLSCTSTAYYLNKEKRPYKGKRALGEWVRGWIKKELRGQDGDCDIPEKQRGKASAAWARPLQSLPAPEMEPACRGGSDACQPQPSFRNPEKHHFKKEEGNGGFLKFVERGQQGKTARAGEGMGFRGWYRW
eukprot:6180684-Pleurochrysis_carterae.AAC.1